MCSTLPWPFPVIISRRTRAIRAVALSIPARARQFMTKSRDTPIARAISPGLARPVRIRWSARSRIGCEALATDEQCYRLVSIGNAPAMQRNSEQWPNPIGQRFQRPAYKPRAAQQRSVPQAHFGPSANRLGALPLNPSRRTLPHMTDTSVAMNVRPSAPANPGDDDKPSKPLRVTGKLRAACDYLVHEGLHFDEAARKANLSVRAMRYALGRSHVVAYLRQQREILREAMCGANILALADVRDQRENHNARVAAVKVMEQMGETTNTRAGSGASQVPGFTIVLNVQGNITGSLTEQQRGDAAKPLILHAADTLTESVDR